MHLDSVIPPSTAVSIQEAVYTADVSVLQKRLGDEYSGAFSITSPAIGNRYSG